MFYKLFEGLYELSTVGLVLIEMNSNECIITLVSQPSTVAPCRTVDKGCAYLSVSVHYGALGFFS